MTLCAEVMSSRASVPAWATRAPRARRSPNPESTGSTQELPGKDDVISCFAKCLGDYMTGQDISSGVSVSLSALARREEFLELRQLVTSDADALSKTLIGTGCLTAGGAQHRSTIPVTFGILKMLMSDRPGRAFVSPSRDRPPAASRCTSTAAAPASTAPPSASTTATTSQGSEAVAQGVPVIEGGGIAEASVPEAAAVEAAVVEEAVVEAAAPKMGADVVRAGWTALVAVFWWLLFLPIRCLAWICRMVVAFRAAAAAIVATVWAFVTPELRANFRSWLWTLATTDSEVAKVSIRRGFNKTQAGIDVIDYFCRCSLDVITYAGQCFENIRGRLQLSTEPADPSATPIPSAPLTSSATPTPSPEPTPSPSSTSKSTPSATFTPDAETPPAAATPVTSARPVDTPAPPSPPPTVPTASPACPGACVADLCALKVLSVQQVNVVFTCVLGALANRLKQTYHGPLHTNFTDPLEWSWDALLAGLADVIPSQHSRSDLGALLACTCE